MTEKDKVVLEVAEKITGTIMKRVPWTSREDVFQEACAGILAALPKADATHPAFRNYLYLAGIRMCNRQYWSDSSLLSINRSHPTNPVAIPVPVGDKSLDGHWDLVDSSHQAAPERLHRRRAAYVVRGRLAELVGEELVDVVLGEEKPQAAAERLGLPVARVRQRTSNAKAKLAADRRVARYRNDG